MNKLYIFDLDGTLVDSLGTIAHFGNIALKSVGLEAVETEKYKYFVGDGKKILIHRMLDYYGADEPETYRKTEEIYDKNYESDTMYKTKAYDGITDLLNELKRKGAKLAVCSNKPNNVVQSIVSILFGDIFDVVTGLEDGAKKKPDPTNALMTAKAVGAPVSECIFIGDTNVDILTAKNAGMRSIGVLWGFRDKKELVDAGADYIAKVPSDILLFN